MPGKRKKTKNTTAAAKKQTQTPEILIRKTNMVQMASMTQAEKKTKLDDNFSCLGVWKMVVCLLLGGRELWFFVSLL